MIKKVLIAIAVVIGLALVAIIVVPHFIDWNPILKSTITTTAKEITGRDLTIEGDIGLTILPTPTFSAAKVRFANGSGGSVADMATLESLDLRVALFSLLSGAIKVESVTLVAPKIVLETLPDGTSNWQFASPSAAPSGTATGGTAAGGGKPQAFQLDRLAIERGTLIYRDASGQAQTVEDLAATISAGSVKGPFLATGSAKVRGTPVKFDISTGALTDGTPAPVGIAVLLADADAKLSFNGTVSLAATIPSVTGKLKAEGSDLGRLVVTLVPNMKGSLPPTLAQSFAVNGDIALDNPSASVKNIVLQLGDAKATGQLLLGFGPPLKADLTLALNRVDLDKLIGAPPAVAPSPAATAGGAASSPTPVPFALPDNVEAKIALTADAITFRGGVIGNARLNAVMAKGVVDLTQLSAEMPGSSEFTVAGRLVALQGLPSFAGTVKSKSDNLRGVFDWLKLTRPPVPTDRLRKVSFAANIAASWSVPELFPPESVEAKDIDLQFDSTKVTGAAVASLPQVGKRTQAGYGVSLVIDQINLDGYVPKAGIKPAGATTATATGGGAANPIGLPLEELKSLNANVKLRIDSLTSNEQVAKGVQLDATVQNGTLTVNDASVKDFAGGRGAVSGTVSDLAGKPRFDTQIDLSASDGAKALQFAGMANPPPQIGALKVGGKLSGNSQDVGFDLAFSLAGIGAQGRAKGKATEIFAGVPRIDGNFQLTAKDAGPLLALAGLPAAAKLGAIDVSGNAASGADDVTYKIVLALPGVGGKGMLDGKLTRLTTTKQVDTKLDLRAETPGPLLTMAGLSGDIVGKTGPLGVAGSLNGGIDKMALDLKLIGLGGSAAIKGNVAAGQNPPSFALDIAASHPDLRQLVAAVSGSPGPAGAFKLSTQATGSTRKASLANLSVEAGPSRVTGKVDYDASSSRPKINADLQAGTLDLAAFGAGGGGGGGAAAGSGGGSTGGGGRWSRQRMDLSALDSFDGSFSLVADALIASGTRIDKAQVKVNLQAGTLTVARFAGGLYGGTIDANGELASRGTASLNANLKASNIAIEQVMQAGYLGTKFGGPVSVSANFAATGNSQAEWIEGLNGKGSLSGSIKLLTRLDQQIGSAALDILGQKVKGVRGVTDVVNGAFSAFAGSTNTLSGDFVIRRGLLETNNVSFTNNLARTLTHGTANLPPYTMNMATDVFRGGGNEPFVTATLTGPIDGPNIKLGGAGFAGAAGALTSPEAVGGVLQQVAPGVAGKLGGGATGTGVGGVLQQVAPGLAGKAGGTAAPGATGTAPGSAGVTSPAAPGNATAPNKAATTQPGVTQPGAPGAAGTGQAQPAPAPNKKKKNNKLDQILPQILGN